MRPFVLCAALAPSIVAGLYWDGPAPTNVADEVYLDLNGMSPVPTEAPGLEFELFRRQSSDADRTCGYVGGDYGNALTCNPGYICAINSHDLGAGCCQSASISGNCFLSTGCLGYTAISTASASVLADTLLTKCTNSLYQYCYTAVFPIGTATYSYFGCSTSPNKETALQTYTNGPSSSPSGTFALGGSSTTHSSTTTTTSPSASNTATQSASPVPPHHSHIGAIVGGAVGGVLGLALLAGLLAFCLIHSRNKKKKAAAASTTTPAGGAPPMAEQQQHYAAPQQPNYAPQQPQYGQQAPAPHGGFYPTAGAAAAGKQDYYQQQNPAHLSGQYDPKYAAPYGSPPHSPGNGAASPVAPPYQTSASPAPPHGVAEAPGVEPPQRHELM